MGGRERTKRVQAAVYRTARLADAGQDVVNESVAAKVFATKVANQLVNLAVQPVGGEALVRAARWSTPCAAWARCAWPRVRPTRCGSTRRAATSIWARAGFDAAGPAGGKAGRR